MTDDPLIDAYIEAARKRGRLPTEQAMVDEVLSIAAVVGAGVGTLILLWALSGLWHSNESTVSYVSDARVVGRVPQAVGDVEHAR